MNLVFSGAFWNGLFSASRGVIGFGAFGWRPSPTSVKTMGSWDGLADLLALALQPTWRALTRGENTIGPLRNKCLADPAASMVIYLMQSPGLFGYLKIPFASSHSSLCSLKFHRSFMFIEFTKKWEEICLARKPQEMSPEDFAAATHALAERGQEVPTNVIQRRNDISLFYWPHLTYLLR